MEPAAHLVDAGILEQIRQGDWSPSVTNQLAQAFLTSADGGAGLCAQLLRAACAAGDGSGTLNVEDFGRCASDWVERCVETVENTEATGLVRGSSDPIRTRVSAALVETIWALNIEWEPDTADDSSRWDEERLRHLEQSKSLVSVAKALVDAGVVDSDVAKERLDADFLEQIGAIPSATVFTRKYIRLNTALHFKQTKFNLASEQNEGFAKLVVLVEGTMAAVAPHHVRGELRRLATPGAAADSRGSAVILALRAMGDLQDRVRLLLTDIRRLIGVFNIDPNRALDVILDCFMSNVRFYWPFYVALLDASPWCQGDSESLKLAQLVGWKLQFYASETAQAARFVDELLAVAALLIAHGLIRLADIYPMLSPTQSEHMGTEFDAWCAAQKDTRAPGATSRLADMGSLEDAGDGSERAEVADAQAAEAGGAPTNQHAVLCAKLLAIGDTEDALVYLKRFPNVARVHPEIADQAVRIVDMATDGIYRRTDCVRAPQRPYLRLRARAAAPEADTPATGPWGIPSRQQGQPPETPAASKHYVLSPQEVGPGDEFFYEEFWLLEAGRRLPTVATIDDVPRALAPWLNVAFLRLHRSPALLTRLIRLCRYGLLQQSDKHTLWVGFLRAWILPAYSLSKPSPGLSNELWRLVSVLELPARFALYSDWSAMLTSGKPMLPRLASRELDDQSGARSDALDMAMSLDDMLEDGSDDDGDDGGGGGLAAYVEIEVLGHSTRRQVRSMMRRLSGDTVKLIGRQLCNLCHPTPTLSLKIILDQVCSYDNLVDSVVEAFRYLTPLSADVLFCLILSLLDDPTSAKVKEDGVNAAHWLQSLALFVAMYSHRHESPTLGVVLDYVLRQVVRMVHTEDAPPVFEMVILSEAIGRLATIDVMANATDDQVLALQGGYRLNLEAFSMVSQWVLPQDATVDGALGASSASRLTRRLAGWLTSLLADQGQALSFAVAACIHADKVLKMAALPLSNMLVIYDREIERVYQLFHLLHTNLKPDRYARLIPGPHVLASVYGLDWGMAILWGRPNISRHLAQGLRQWESDGEKIVVKITGRGGPADGDSSQADAQHPREGVASAPLQGEDTRMDVDVDADSNTVADPAAGMSGRTGRDAPAGEGGDGNGDGNDHDDGDDDDAVRVVESVYFEAPLLPRDYVEHVARTLPQSVADVGLSPEFVAAFWALSLYDIEVPTERYAKEVETQSTFIGRVDALAKQPLASKSKAAALAQVRSRASAAVEGLEKEMAEQREHVQRIRRWLIAQKDYWFCMTHEQRKLVTQALLQHCILPRAVLSASDASFCAKFLWMMHFPLATNKFSLMIVYDNIFSESLSTLLAALTENEARNYARFLNTSLAYLAPLHLSEANYNDRAVNAWRGLTGFQKQWHYERGYLPPKSRTIRQRMPSQPPAGSGDARRIKPGSVMLSYEDFRTVMRKWQVNLTKAFICVLEAERSDTVRNGLLALKEMQKSFPVISQYGRRILDKVNEVAAGGRTAGPRDGAADGEDKNLKVMAASYGAYLSMAKRNWISEADYFSMPSKSTPRRTPQPATRQKGRGPDSNGGAASPAAPKTDGGQRMRQRPLADRVGPGSKAVAVAVAAAAAAAAAAVSSAPEAPSAPPSASRSGSTGNGDASAQGEKGAVVGSPVAQEQPSEPRANRSGSGGGRDRDRDRDPESGREGSWGRARDRQRARHPDAESASREHHSVRGSPARHGRSVERVDTHSLKRPHDSQTGGSSSGAEPRRQRAPGSSDQEQPRRQPSPQPAAKMSSEEVDRKRKELRAQLQRQQEEKQKQGRQGDGGEPAGRRDWGGRGTPAKHGSGKDSPKPGDGASREPGGRRGRHGGGRSPDPGAADHAQQPQPQQQKRPALSTQPAQSGRADRDPRRSGRGSRRAPEDSAPPLRGSGGQQGRRGSESADGKGAGDQPGGGGGGRRGPKRGRGTEPRDWDDGKRPRN